MSRRPALLVAVLALPGLTACSAPKCGTFIGDSSKAPEAQTLAFVNGQLKALADGDTVPLELPPQGGFVSYVGARVRNVYSCRVEQKGDLVQPTSGALIGTDTRRADLTAGPDGWGYPPTTVTAIPNIAVCPNTSAAAVERQTVKLQLTITDVSGKTAQVSTSVVPTCQQTDAAQLQACQCSCAPNYQPGKCTAMAGDLGATD